MRGLTKMLMASAASAVLCAAPMLAQGKPLPPQTPPTRAQQGEAGPANPPAAPAATGTITPQAYYRNDGGQPALYTAIPVTVASDGRVYANFGAGYTWVQQQCSAQRLAQLGVLSAVGQRQSRQPQVTQPSPTGASTAPTVNGTSSTQQATGPCWTQARNGLVVVYR